jgi:DNA polymerase-3 subunit delta
MADFSPQALDQTLTKGEIYPLYYLYGDETFLIEDALARLTDTALGEGLKDFNLNTYYGGEVDAAQIRDAVETLPMMAQVRVVIVKDAQDLTDKEWELLAPLVDNPVPTTAFICVATKVDKRKKFIKAFMAKGVVVEYKRPYDNQIPDWIRSIGKKYGLTLDSEAVSTMHQLVGSNLQDIDGEMLKLSQFMGQNKKVASDDVLKVVSRLRIDSVFDLTEAIGRNDRARALTCLANLLDHGQNEVGVLALISRHVRILKLVADGLREGLSGPKLASRAGVSPYFLKSYVDQARAWSDRKIEHTFQALVDTDRALKSSPVASHIWLENFVVQTCT